MSPASFRRSLSVPDISWRTLGHRHKFLLCMLGLLTLLCTVYLYFAVTLGANDSCLGLGRAQRVRCQLHANTLKGESMKAHHRRLLYAEDADSSDQEMKVHSGGSKKDFLEFLKSWHASIKDKEESEITRLKGVITSLQGTITNLHRSNARLRKTVTALLKEHHTFPEDDHTPAKAIPVPPTTSSASRRATRLRGDI